MNEFRFQEIMGEYLIPCTEWMENINKNKTEFNSLEFERLIQEERKTNPDYFKGEVVDNGDSFTITPSQFYKDLFKAITKDN